MGFASVVSDDDWLQEISVLDFLLHSKLILECSAMCCLCLFTGISIYIGAYTKL